MREELNISIINLCSYIFENNEVNTEDDVKELFLEKENNFKIFENIKFFKDEDNFLTIFEHKNYTLSLNLNNCEVLDIAFLDPFLFEKGILKKLDTIIIEDTNILTFYEFLKNKNHRLFYYKKHLLDNLINFGINVEEDVLSFDESVDLKLDDLILLMSESYLKALNNRKL